MFSICDARLHVITYCEFLHQAKGLAERTSRASNDRLLFVCDSSGSVVAGYGTNAT
jgi:hypothetical protein